MKLRMNRPLRTRTVGGVGGAGQQPVPTRLGRSLAVERLAHFNLQLPKFNLHLILLRGSFPAENVYGLP